jgi:hypothetical protein
MGVGPSDCSPTCLSLAVVPPRFLGLAKPETHQLLRLRHYPQHRPLIRVLVAREQCGRVSFHPPTSGHSTRHTTGCRRPASVRAVSCWLATTPHGRGRPVPATQTGWDPSLSPTTQLTSGLSSKHPRSAAPPDPILLAPSQRSKADCHCPFTRSAALRRHPWLPPALPALPGRV